MAASIAGRLFVLAVLLVVALPACRTRSAEGAAGNSGPSTQAAATTPPTASALEAPAERVAVHSGATGTTEASTAATGDNRPALKDERERPDEAGPVTTLSESFRSERALAEAVLRAVAANDPDALGQLRVNRAEYQGLLWPEFPQAKDPRHTLTPEFHWNLLDSSSKAGIRDVLTDFGGTEFELLEVRPRDGIAEYDSFRLLRKIELRVRRLADGREGVLRILGSIVERDGQFKLLSYPS